MLQNKEFYILFLAIAISIYQALETSQISSIDHERISINSMIDVVMIQKLLLCIFLLVWLHRFEQTSIKILEFVAAIGFSIFFLHGYAIIVTQKIFNKFEFEGLKIFSNFVVIDLFIISICLIICISVIVVVIKKLFSKYSRYFIGS